MKRLQRKSLKWKQSYSQFSEKEYNDCFRSVNLPPMTYHFAFLNLLVLNRILTRKFPLQTEQYWQIKNGHPKTRSNKKIFLYSTKCNHQRCRFSFLYRFTNFNSLMSLTRGFPNYNPYSSPPKSNREVKEYLLDLVRRILITNRTHMYGQCLKETNLKPR